MKTFKTPKGTELPLLSLRGKDYLQVAHRLVWFREEHPNWSIETEVKPNAADKSCISWACIKDETGKILSTSHKCENEKGFPDYIEKSETGAIGRALALVGYGTQFAPELDEESRIVDAPIERSNDQWKQPAPPSSSDHFAPYGKCICGGAFRFSEKTGKMYCGDFKKPGQHSAPFLAQNQKEDTDRMPSRITKPVFQESDIPF